MFREVEAIWWLWVIMCKRTNVSSLPLKSHFTIKLNLILVQVMKSQFLVLPFIQNRG